MNKRKKAQAKLIKEPISERFGNFFARRVPGSAVKLGRMTKKAGNGIITASDNFRTGFWKGWDDV